MPTGNHIDKYIKDCGYYSNGDATIFLKNKTIKIMKTSTINVNDMLSVLSVDEVEKRIGEVPGVESVTVNFAAGNATVRYDETRLEATDIKSAVRQKSYESDAPEQSTVKPVEDKAEGQATPPAKAENTNEPSPITPAVKPEEEKTEIPATPPAVTATEEKDEAETETPAGEEKKEDDADHNMDEMSKNKE